MHGEMTCSGQDLPVFSVWTLTPAFLITAVIEDLAMEVFFGNLRREDPTLWGRGNDGCVDAKYPSCVV